MLIARRGAPVARAELCALLWPDVEPGRTGNRLSVAVSTLRAVLDPEREWPADRYVATGDAAVWLRREHLDIDVEAFLEHARAALTTMDIEELRVAEAGYAGDFGEEAWAADLRDEARTAYVAVARTLTRMFATRGEPQTAIRYLLRLLACAPYDEDAHLGLVRALDAVERHGDARRAYRAYAARMDERGRDRAPYPGA